MNGILSGSKPSQLFAKQTLETVPKQTPGISYFKFTIVGEFVWTFSGRIREFGTQNRKEQFFHIVLTY